MRSLTRLLEHQGTLLRDIEVAARKRDAALVLALQRRLETLASLIRRQEEIDRTLATFEQGGLAAEPDTPITTTEGPGYDDNREVSAKERGRRRREDFVRTLASKGVALERLRGAIFRSPHGIRVGVAYNRGKNDKWFLNLPEDGFEHAVLLCEERSGRVIHFSLPKEFLDEHGDALSRTNGQVKFNVRRRGEFFLHLPKRGYVTIEPFRDNFSGLI